jgi:hypothetical protein
MQDCINVEILEDGTIKSTTDKISAPNHSKADQFFEVLQDFVGGIKSIKRRVGMAYSHVHVHGSHHHKH